MQFRFSPLGTTSDLKFNFKCLKCICGVKPKILKGLCHTLKPLRPWPVGGAGEVEMSSSRGFWGRPYSKHNGEGHFHLRRNSLSFSPLGDAMKTSSIFNMQIVHVKSITFTYSAIYSSIFISEIRGLGEGIFWSDTAAFQFFRPIVYLKCITSRYTFL